MKELCLTIPKSHSVHPPPLFCRGDRVSNQIFKKGELDRTSTEGVGGKEVGDFFQGEGCNFHMKIKLKSEIFNDKKILSAKIFFSIITKNSNREILPKNLFTFKR